jgi:hypothetical protein
VKKVNVNEIWKEFVEKLRINSLKECDFGDDMKYFLFSFLCGKDSHERREKFINSSTDMVDGEYRKSVIVSCPDDKYRFDFAVIDNKWKLIFLECITLPLNNINCFPYDLFISLPEKESWIKAERNISRIVYFFCKLRKIINLDEALLWFNDGAGEFLCARSWVPFYNDSKSFILYCGWIENRINGENISIEMCTDEKCIIHFKEHLWFKVYHSSSHLNIQISFEEYKKLFESIWLDRAFHSGWEVEFTYDGNDTILTFYNK